MGGGRIDDQFVIFNLVPEGNMASDAVALQGRLSHAPGDLLREVSRVKLGHAL